MLIIAPVLSFSMTTDPSFVKAIEENPILEILFGKESITSSFIKITKLSGSIIATGKTLSVVPMLIIQSVKLIAEFVVL